MHLCSLVVYLNSGIGLSVVRHLVVDCAITCFGYSSFTFILTVESSLVESRQNFHVQCLHAGTLFPHPFGAHAFPLPRCTPETLELSRIWPRGRRTHRNLSPFVAYVHERRIDFVVDYDSILVVLPSKNLASVSDVAGRLYCFRLQAGRHS